MASPRSLPGYEKGGALYADTPAKSAAIIAKRLDPHLIRGLAAAGILGSTGLVIDYLQGDDIGILENALLETAGTGALATGVGAGLGYLDADLALKQRIEDADREVLRQKVRARDIQNRSPNADMDVPMRNAAAAINKRDALKDPSVLRGMRRGRMGNAMKVTAAGAGLANLINALRDEAPQEIVEENNGTGSAILGGTGLAAAALLASGYPQDYEHPSFDLDPDYYPEMEDASRRALRKKGL